MRFYIHGRGNGAASIMVALQELGHTLHPQGGGLTVNWGHKSTDPNALNRGIGIDKLRQLRVLQEEGVSVPPFQVEVPQNKGAFYPRLLSHSEGKDIMKCLRGEASPDFYTEYIPFKKEVRFHIFRGKSIRCGVKVPIHPLAAHPHIRSARNGWTILYGKETLLTHGVSREERESSREVAKNSLEVLGLDFGAVDMGLCALTGQPVVLEVNTAPGISGKMPLLYAREIEKWGREVERGRQG